MLFSLPKNRWQAFFSHLLISAILFSVLVWVIVGLWYPGVFVDMGGWAGIKIVAGVDLVLGPLLTLIIYNKNKKEIKWDLAIIACIQSACLAYGMWMVYQERPLLQVFTDDSLYVLTAGDMRLYGLGVDIVDEYVGDFPKKIYLDLPNKIVFIF